MKYVALQKQRKFNATINKPSLTTAVQVDQQSSSLASITVNIHTTHRI